MSTQTSMYLLDQSVIDACMPKSKFLKFKNFEPQDLEGFRGLDDYELSNMSIKDRKQYFINQSQHGPTISAIHDNHTFGVYGAVHLWRGVAEAWSIFDNDLRRYKIAMCKGAFGFFDMLFIYYDLHRIQITVKKDDERAIAWATYLGFEPEGLMKAYSEHKEDTYMMGITRWEK